MQKMKRFTMMLAAVLLMVGAAFVPAKAATIVLDPTPADDATFSAFKGAGTTTIKFTLTQAADVTINLLGIGLGQVSMSLCTTSASCGTPVATDPSNPPSLASLFILSTAEFSYANLSATTYYLNIIGSPAFVGFVLGNISAVAATPIPASLVMFLTALGGLGFVAKRRRALSSAMA
jgi:hypothetical protein